jgi:hypothetical protein
MSKMKARMGRPPLPPADKRSKCVMVRLTPGEYRALKAVARQEGLALARLLMKPWREHEGELK